MPLNLLYELNKCENISYAEHVRLKSGDTRPPRLPPIDAHAVKNFPI